MANIVRPSPRRSAFSAAFLSFLFPGLGQVYAGAYRRAILLAAPAFLAIAIMVALFLSYGLVDFGLWIAQSSVLGPLAIANIFLLAYRAAVSIDAYRLLVAQDAPGAPPRSLRIGRSPGRLNPFSIAGLAMILVVLVAGHAIAGYWDLKFYNLARDIHSPDLIDTSSPDAGADITASPMVTPTFPPQETVPPAATIKPWTGTDRLNILLVGMDASGRRTDSTIVVSIDPVTHRVFLFSVLRDAISIPMPPKSRLSRCFGPYFGEILTNLWLRAEQSCKNLFPNGGSEALKQALGYTFFGDQTAIQYYIKVDFKGFEKLVDTLGGVTINVPAPVKDDTFPSNAGGNIHVRVYVPAGIQHMDGNEALTYARMGHATPGSSNFARAVRQQQVVVAIEQQANLGEISSHLGDLVDALGQTVKTDIPEGPDVVGPLIQLAKSIKSSDIAPPIVWAGSHPNYAAIRSTVKAMLAPSSKTPNALQTAIVEDAPIVVENGTLVSGQDTTLASQLQGFGFNAQASTDQPATLGGTTQLLCLNGAETQFPATLAFLEQALGLTGSPSADPSAPVQTVTDANEAVQFVIVTGTNTPPTIAAPSPSS